MATDEDKISAINRVMTRYPDFPKPGINFIDIFPLMRQPALMEDLISIMTSHIRASASGVQLIVGLEARGFIFGPIIAQRLGVGFAPVRKKGKLPGETIQVSYSLEYGGDTFEIQKSAVTAGQKVVIVDDLLATGGTMAAACQLMSDVKAEVLECMVVVELTQLNGRAKVPAEVYSVVKEDS